jgi:hypothetical protein
MLDYQIQKKLALGKMDRSDAVDAMEEAGTVDLRGQEDLSYLLRALGPTAPAGTDPRTQDMRNRLAAWAGADAHRRDHNHDGQYDDAVSPAIMDAWWPRATAAIFAGNGNPIGTLGIGLDDTNRIHHIGSSFQDGTYGQINKDLRQVLGDTVKGRMSRTYCGDGNLATCRNMLWASLALAASDLNAEFDSPNVADWRRTPDYEDVRHSAVGVTTVPAIHWINRPTFQQVVQINGTRWPEPIPQVQSLSGANNEPTVMNSTSLSPSVADNRSTVAVLPMDRRINFAA